MNYYIATEEGKYGKRVVFAWPRGESPHQSKTHFSIRGPWSSHQAAQEALEQEEKEVDKQD